jgi:hypothetical protein
MPVESPATPAPIIMADFSAMTKPPEKCRINLHKTFFLYFTRI